MVLVEIQLIVLEPHCWPHPSVGGARACSRKEGRVRSHSVGGDILPLGRLAAYKTYHLHPQPWRAVYTPMPAGLTRQSAGLCFYY